MGKPDGAMIERSRLQLDRRAFLLASAIILWVIVVARRLVHPADPAAWSYQALMLCLVVGAIAGRALLGYRSRNDSRDLSWSPALAWGVVVLASLLPYLHSATIQFVSDDFGLALIAREARTPAEAMSSTGLIGFYRPLVMFVWWAGDRLWHGAPLGYHLLAMVLHAANSLLVYSLGRRLIGSAYGALLGAMLFAVHPLHVEPVCWPAASSDLLCAAFSLLSLLLLHSYRSDAAAGRRPLLLAGALGAFVLALVSKEVALALPGVAVLMLALAGPSDRRRLFAVGLFYAVVLAAYLAWRVRLLGGIGGYALPMSFWNTVFPSNPLLLIGDFLFPAHTTLLAGAGPAASWAALVLMAGAVLWWLASLDRVPARRLWLWLGFVFLFSVPSWTFRWQPSASFEWSRFGYLPTIGLAWLFGDLCAGRGMGWRRSGGMAGLILVGCALLTVWYVTPWREAGRLAATAVSAGVRFIGEHGGAEIPRALYVQNLPQAYQGAPVFAYCYPQAIYLSTGRHLPIRVVGGTKGAIHPETMAASKLKPGEYLVSFEAKTGAMPIVRSGGAAGSRAPTPGQR